MLSNSANNITVNKIKYLRRRVKKGRQKHWLGNLEDPQQTESSQDTDAKGSSRPEETPEHFEDAANDDLQREGEFKNGLFSAAPQAGTKQLTRIGSTDTAVKAVERRMEVEAWTQAVHLQEHLSQEQSEEQELSVVWRNQKGLRPYPERQLSEGFLTHSQRKLESHRGWLWWTMATHSVLSATRPSTVQ